MVHPAHAAQKLRTWLTLSLRKGLMAPGEGTSFGDDDAGVLVVTVSAEDLSKENCLTVHW